MAPKKATVAVGVADKYKKMDQREHVLLRSNMYIGEVSADACDIWVFNDETATMVKKSVKYIPGLYKIFDEIIVNSIDHSIRLKNEKAKDPKVTLLKNIKVSIDKATGIIEVMNDGDGIEVVKHPEHNIYIPEMIFGNMLTSTNYDDTEERTIGGLNGLGAKLTNIFSTWFEIETIDHERKLAYKQRFESNMSIKKDPEISKCTKKPYTIIRFLPDYARFGLSGGLSEDMFQIMKKRVYDACAVTDNDINIYFNDVKLEYKNFEKYVDLYIGSKDAHTRVFEKISEKWEICASYNNFNGFEQISFVNGIWTIRGGKHVEYIVNQIVKKLTELIAKKKKDVTVKPQTIKDNLILFVKSTIVNPNFDSQSKETLTTPMTKFGSKAEVSDKFVDKLYKSGIVEKILEISEIQDNKKLQKSDGKKKNTIRGLPKLEDANWAGTVKSRECTLILCEGDSAQTMVISGLAEVGRDRYGSFPLRGKLMNVKDQTVKKIAENEEITNLKKILGLETGKEYKSVDDLRYGKIMILTDQDSVTYDTSCLVKDIETGLIDCRPICELNDGSWYTNPITNKEYSTCNKYYVWSDRGWTKINSVMRHYTNKPIHRVLTHTGCVDVTEDHSLLAKNGTEITVKDCVVKETELLHSKFMQDSVSNSNITEEYAYALGYFLADGNCSTDNTVKLRVKDKVYNTCNSTWCVDCVEKEPLLKLKDIFERYECIDENNEKVHQNPELHNCCSKCGKYFKDAWALRQHQNRKSDCANLKKLTFEIIKVKFGKGAYSSREFKYKLQAKGVRKQIAHKYRTMFYNSLREKKVPSEILNAPVHIQQSFLDGFYAGDGTKGDRTTDRFDGEGKTQMMGLFQVLQNCGYNPSINCSSKKVNVYNILMGKYGYWRPEHTIKKIFDVSAEYANTYVYDFETENHHFHGSIGNLIVHNCDGSHIKGLLFNMFHSMWPSLVKCNEFMTSMLTPIVKVSKGSIVKSFYNLTDYDNWFKENNGGKGWEIKYYKGLGTSTDEEAKEYFRNMNKIDYKYTGNISDDRLDLAFNKKKADERKDWLGGYDKQQILDVDTKQVTYEDFIDKELIHFSNYDVERSIPNICDGLKVSQRKILFACFKKNLTTKEIKVAQLAGYVSENAAYHHGEASLQSAIVGMAQKFVGSNNINLLKPNGQFGTRRLGGKDAASPRYIFTLLEQVTMALFRKDDSGVLTYLNDDGLDVEPEYYMPVIPMVLVNGALGIGTGFSTNIPCYNPKDIMGVVRQIIAGENVDGIELKPWYRGFNGTIEKSGDKYVSRGTFTKVTATKVDITELPVGMWIQDFKEFLEEYMDKHPEIKNYESHYTDKEVRFSIFFNTGASCDEYLKLESNGYTKLENEFKLVSSKLLSTSNMYLFNSKCQIQKYATVIDIIKDWCLVRLTYYTKRKDKLLAELKADMEMLNNKIRFIKAVVAEQIVVHKMKKHELEERLEKDKYTKIEDKYDYLLRIPIYNLTIDKVAELEAEKAKADAEYNRVLNLDVKDWWSEDLNEFSRVYDAFLVECENGTGAKGATKPKVVKKVVALKK